MKEWLGGRNFSELKRRAEDRCEWRYMVANALLE